jgi:3-phosphoglycerate kinase
MFQIQSNNSKGLQPIGLVHPESLRGKKVIVRCDFNAPIKKGKIVDDVRIKGSYKTINYLKNSGAKIILLSHIGRDPEDSLRPVYKFLKKTYKISFIEDFDFPDCNKFINRMDDGEIVLFENLRQRKEEKAGDVGFAKLLASMGEIFVNEAFSVSHRDHASITGIPQFIHSYIGFQFKDEIENISKVFDPEHPFLVLMGGAKFQTKIKLINTLDEKADSIFVGGALANDIFRAKGIEVGTSVVSDINKEKIKKIADSEKVFTPVDVKVLTKIGLKKTKKFDQLKEGDTIMDGGKQTFKILQKEIKKAKMIVWNGPFGLYEEGYDYLTKKVAGEIAKSDAFSIVGGGDTLTEISRRKNFNDYGFVSLGGGAMLEFISSRTLVGIEALKSQVSDQE